MKAVKKTKFTKAYEQGKLPEAIDEGTTLNLKTHYGSFEARTDLIADRERLNKTIEGQRQGGQKGADAMRRKAARDAKYIKSVARQLIRKDFPPRERVKWIKAFAESDRGMVESSVWLN